MLAWRCAAATRMSTAHSAQPPSRQTSYPRTAPSARSSRVRELGRAFDGEVGIAVREVETGRATSWNGDRFFPQQSVSKFWVALTAFPRADAGELDLPACHDPPRRSDPVPPADRRRSRRQRLYDDARGPDVPRPDPPATIPATTPCCAAPAARARCARCSTGNRIYGVRFGPGERLMQCQIAGLQWSPAFSVGRAFYAARNAVPDRAGAPPSNIISRIRSTARRPRG